MNVPSQLQRSVQAIRNPV